MERWGPEGDGGYVVPADVLKRASVLVTGGVSTNVEFEVDVAKANPNIRIGLFDHTISHAPDHTPANATWYKLGLGSAGDCISLETAAEMSGATADNILAVKFDIEGAEWELLESTPEAFWDRVAVLITELHGFDKVEEWDRYQQLLGKLDRILLPVHIHANNWAQTIRLKREGVEFPITIEATHLNRKLIPNGITPTPWKHRGPTALDRRNKSYFIDIPLHYWSPSKNPLVRLWRRFISATFPWRLRKNIVYNLTLKRWRR
jgi:hypothetical protein